MLAILNLLIFPTVEEQKYITNKKIESIQIEPNYKAKQNVTQPKK